MEHYRFVTRRGDPDATGNRRYLAHALVRDEYSATYDEDANALYLSVSSTEIAQTRQIRRDVLIDYDTRGKVVGVEVLGVLPNTSQPVDTAAMTNLFHNLGDRVRELFHEAGDELERLVADLKPKAQEAVADVQKGAEQTVETVERDVAA